MRIIFAVIILSCIHVRDSVSYRILAICPTPARSHQLVFHSILEKVVERGHELVILTTNPIDTDHPNITQIDLSLSYRSRLATENFFKTRGLQLVTMGLEDIPSIIEMSLLNPFVQELIHNPNEKFDAVFVEYLGYTPFYSFVELFDAAFIGFTTLEMDSTQHEALGNAVHPATHSPNLMGFYRGSNIFRRVWNTGVYVFSKFLKVQFYSKFDEIIDRHFGDKVVLKSDELVRKIDLLFLQQNPLLGSVRPMVPNIITTSFLLIRPTKPLPNALKSYLDGSQQGAIYFSLGTMVRSDDMDATMRETFRQAFDGLKYNVLWKHGASVSNSSSKILTSSWFPQQDLLDHPNVKLFITQGGLQSVEEAISRGVPMVVIPFFYDQYDNAEMVERKQIGIRLSRDFLTPEKIQAAIQKVMSDPKYKANILRLRQAIQDQPMEPRDKVAWWLEYAIRNREELQAMRYSGADLPFYQRYFLDVACVLATFLALIVTFLRLCYSRLRRCFCNSSKVVVGIENKEKKLS